MDGYDLCNVFNTDQSGFNLEIHSGRTLDFRGVKHVLAVCEQINLTTHSYTIQPIISATGKFVSPLFVVLKENNDKFGPMVRNELRDIPSNVYVTCSTSGKMTKAHLKEFYNKVLFDKIPDKSMVLVDSWTSYKDKNLIESSLNSKNKQDVQLFLIPEGCTPFIQPCDVYFFRPYKNFVRNLEELVLQYDDNIYIKTRLKIIHIQSITHNQFSSPRYNPMIKYAFISSGYNVGDKNDFINPVDFSFKKLEPGTNKCQFNELCDNFVIIKCGWCNKYLCLNHLFIDKLHICDEYNP